MAASYWSNVQVAVQSALAAAITIDAITKLNPGVVTVTGATPIVAGGYGLFTIQGMSQLDQRVVRFANVVDLGATYTFELEGVDTTLFDTFSTGTFEVITFGTTLTSAVGINASGGDYETADITTIHDTVRKIVPTVSSALQYTFDCLWDPADTALVALKAASDAKTTRAIKFTFSNSKLFLFSGYVGASLAPTGSAQEAVKTSVTLTAYGRPTAYNS